MTTPGTPEWTFSLAQNALASIGQGSAVERLTVALALSQIGFDDPAFIAFTSEDPTVARAIDRICVPSLVDPGSPRAAAAREAVVVHLRDQLNIPRDTNLVPFLAAAFTTGCSFSRLRALLHDRTVDGGNDGRLLRWLSKLDPASQTTAFAFIACGWTADQVRETVEAPSMSPVGLVTALSAAVN